MSSRRLRIPRRPARRSPPALTLRTSERPRSAPSAANGWRPTEMTTTTTRMTAARPTVSVEGRDEASLAEGLLTMRVEETTDALYRCEATFGNWGASAGATTFLYFDRKLLDFGKELAFSVGGKPIFRGRVSALEGEFPEGSAPRLTL